MVETDNGTTVWFSYETPIGFHNAIGGAWTRVNDWGPTTGKHINYVEREFGLKKAARLAGDVFETQLANTKGVTC
jgi:hypothetical protein